MTPFREAPLGCLVMGVERVKRTPGYMARRRILLVRGRRQYKDDKLLKSLISIKHLPTFSLAPPITVLPDEGGGRENGRGKDSGLLVSL